MKDFQRLYGSGANMTAHSQARFVPRYSPCPENGKLWEFHVCQEWGAWLTPTKLATTFFNINLKNLNM